ncbi:uncharacterized protein MELLADRAFT_103625 [Melampsora larici-populina 98AG31]|uniref:Uncharacterized protein n=1 Tax=Melampsora larici-populina (strain 98AG31 / pathotype 3-4-7) TaxID=747676 RepID=F4RBY1_MELLP|nr:uncharacterized protein MELLADRAFT_103625 [Melampsora larici-populina 98AG31]EGG10260.1 hypothetical protein MELLADRAFT_103625 [Melampsora larici-populina 98AG31]
MRPNKPGKTPKSWPGLYTIVEADTAEPSRSPLITSADAFHFPADIHNWLPFPLVHLAPPPAGFDFNPISNCFVCNTSRQPPHFDTNVVRLSLPRKAGIEKDVIFAMTSSSIWIYQGKHFNGQAKKSTDQLAFENDLSHRRRGPTRQHKWTKSWLCNCYGKPSTHVKPTLTSATCRSGGSVRVSCPAKFYIRKTMTGDLEFEGSGSTSATTLTLSRTCATCAFPTLSPPVPQGQEQRSWHRPRVNNAICCLEVKTKFLSPDVLTSINLWCERLRERGWHVNNFTNTNNKRASVAFLSPWQHKQIRRHGDDVLCFDSTHSVCSGVPEWPLSSFTLLTIVLRHPVTGSGIPVAWFLTTDEKA